MEDMNLNFFYDGYNVAIKLILTLWRFKQIVTQLTMTSNSTESLIHIILPNIPEHIPKSSVTVSLFLKTI